MGVKACRDRGVQVVGYSTLSGWPFTLRAVEDPHVVAMAARYHRSPAQLLLRHALQKGVAVIPASANAERLEMNLSVFDFEIVNQDMLLLDGLAGLASRCHGSPAWLENPYR